MHQTFDGDEETVVIDDIPVDRERERKLYTDPVYMFVLLVSTFVAFVLFKVFIL